MLKVNQVSSKKFPLHHSPVTPFASALPPYLCLRLETSSRKFFPTKREQMIHLFYILMCPLYNTSQSCHQSSCNTASGTQQALGVCCCCCCHRIILSVSIFIVKSSPWVHKGRPLPFPQRSLLHCVHIAWFHQFLSFTCRSFLIFSSYR